ncbi:MAG: hypothetical protein Q9O62_08900 [Ardenticatenia bacterium]|nr:hypothetical protein [Ardenticatenia bacterium]
MTDTFRFSDLVAFGLPALKYAVLALVLYVAPGFALLTWWRPNGLPREERLGLAIGFSVALYPLFFLWLYLLGLPLGPVVAYGLGSASTIAILWMYRHHLHPERLWQITRTWRPHRAHALAIVFWGIMALIFFTRLWAIRFMSAPAWGDSVQHTFIVQLILDNRGLFQDWNGYAPIRSLTYHFGFHTLMAVWAWVVGLPAPLAVLVGAQVLNTLAVASLYPLIVRLSGSRVAGVVGVAVAGLLSPMPAFYVNWGRYTQLAGQTILPTVLWLFDAWWERSERPRPSTAILLIVALAGLAITHYRVVLFAVAGAAAWGLWSLWTWRHQVVDWVRRAIGFAVASLAAVLLVAPWMWHVRTGRLVTLVARSTSSTLPSARAEIQIWGQVGNFFPLLLLALGTLALLLAFRWRPKVAVPLLLWSLFTFVLTNPFVVGLPGAGLITNFALVIALYMPVAVTLGWLSGAVWTRLQGHFAGRVAGGLLLCVLLAWGSVRQARIVDPFFQMITPSDLAAFEWIRSNIPPDARFLVNGFLAYNDSVVVGSDAGWWLPLYTQRANTVPPLLYAVERLAPGVNREAFRQLEIDVRASGGDPTRLRELMCRAQVTHIYLGERRGQVGFGATPLIPEAWLTDNPDFELLFRQGKAQVWRFNTEACEKAGAGI